VQRASKESLSSWCGCTDRLESDDEPDGSARTRAAAGDRLLDRLVGWCALVVDDGQRTAADDLESPLHAVELREPSAAVSSKRIPAASLPRRSRRARSSR